MERGRRPSGDGPCRQRPGAPTRTTGIEVVGEAPWGAHLCQLYATKTDLLDVLVPYFKAGLEQDELCMWITSPPLGAQEAWNALAGAVPDLDSHRRHGRMEIIPHTDWYLPNGSFDKDRVLAASIDKLEGALKHGRAGLRASGNMSWLGKSDWKGFAEYEAAVDAVLGRYRMLALCTYPQERCGTAEVADVIRNHQLALIKRDSRWEMFGGFDRQRMQDALALERERYRLLFTERKRIERLYEVLSRVNEAIVRIHDEQALYEQVCRIVAEAGVFPLVWIGLIEGGKVLPAASSGPATDYLAEISVTVDGELGRGPTGTCVREGRHVVNDDFGTNPTAAPWREPALRRGFRASAAFPLHRHTKVIGVLTLYAERPGAFDAEHVRLLEALSADLSYALDAMEQEGLRKAAEQALRTSEQSLREIDRRKNEFMAVLSHEIRNPLTPIRNSLFVLDHTTPGGAQAEHARAVISRQVEQLSRLVDDLLDVTRIARNEIHLHPQQVDLNQLVERALDDHRGEFDGNGVELELELAPVPPFVQGDPARLTQVVGNLLQNAARFTPRGGRTRVSVSADSEDVKAVIRVADTGVGMTPETLARVFEPFMQADKTLDRSKGGLGLGLALARSLVELHGGEITASSAGLGAGAQLVVRLPLSSTVPTRREAPRSGRRSRARRVLVIEDNVDAAESLCEALTFGGHEVTFAHNGPDGLAKAREFRPEVVLCDIGLPGMDGFDVARAFKADASLGDVFLVALSGYARPEDLQQASEAGFERHVAKPSSIEKLERVLAEAPDCEGS